MYRPIPELTPEQQSRFWDKVLWSDERLCWPWNGCTSPTGYGSFGVNKAPLLTHRIALALTVGDQPDLVAMHSCDNPPCCNPAHLSWGTRQKNTKDAYDRGRMAYGAKLPQSKLTVEAVRDIVTSTELQSVLADKYGVAQNTISRVRSGATWKHATGGRKRIFGRKG